MSRQRREKKHAVLLIDPVSNNPVLNWLWWVVAGFMALLLGGLTHWKVFEYDLFFLIRAGSEILTTGHVQTTDTWSYTVQGQPWFNFQWLTTVILAWIHQTFDHSENLTGNLDAFASLSWLRSALVAFWIGIQLLIVRRVSGRSLGTWVSCLVIIPWIYVAASFRLQMRPDLFASCVYILLVLLAVGDIPSWPAWNEKTRRLIGLGLLLLYANLHSGTAPMGIFFFSAWVFFSKSEKWLSKFTWIAAAALTWLATPIGIHVLDIVQTNFIQYDYSLTGNPDFQPFTLKLLSHEHGGWHLVLWTIYTAFAGICFFALWGDRTRLPKVYRNFVFVGVVGAILTFMVLGHIRSIHYQMIFLLPLVAAGVDHFLRPQAKSRLLRQTSIAAIVAVFLWAWVVPDHLRYEARPLGSSLMDSELPVRSVDFIKKVGPQPNLLNAYDFGGYVVGNLTHYPDALDGREIPFLPILSFIGTAAFISQYNVNIALVHFPGMFYDPKIGFSDTDQARFPISEWAQVYFDNCSVVYLRRIPQHVAAIRDYEYKYLRRGLPYNYGASFNGLSDDVRKGFEQELDRCLADNANNTYCLAGKAAFHEKRKEYDQAFALLNRAVNWNPKNAESLLALSGLYSATGNDEEALRLKEEFGRYTHGL